MRFGKNALPHFIKEQPKMENAMKISALFCFVLGIHLTINAQEYKTAAGLRLGYPTSVSIKHFITDAHALEGYIGTRGYFGYRWTNFSGAYLIHHDIEDIDGLRWYWGAGASMYLWSFNDFGYQGFSTNSVGVQAYGGLDYVFDSAPINITLDWTPTYFINGFGSGLGGGYGSLAVRYVFNR